MVEMVLYAAGRSAETISPNLGDEITQCDVHVRDRVSTDRAATYKVVRRYG